MPEKTVKKSKKSFFILAAVVIIIGAAFFYKNIASVPRVSFENIEVSDGWTRVGKEIMVSTDSAGSSNMTLIVSAGKGVLIDTGYGEAGAKRVKDYIDRNHIILEGIILTHMHNDHIANLQRFTAEGIKLYKPSDLEDGQELTLAGKRLRVLKTDGHTPKNSHASIEIKDDNVLIAGDVVITDGLPAVGGSYKDLIASLERIESKAYAVIIPGHGYIMESSSAVGKNLEYLRNAREKLVELINSGGQLPQIESISIEDCVSGVKSDNEELLKEIHRFNLTNIYLQVRRELGK